MRGNIWILCLLNINKKVSIGRKEHTKWSKKLFMKFEKFFSFLKTYDIWKLELVTLHFDEIRVKIEVVWNTDLRCKFHFHTLEWITNNLEAHLHKSSHFNKFLIHFWYCILSVLRWFYYRFGIHWLCYEKIAYRSM